MTNRTTPTNPRPVSNRPPSLNSPRTSLVKRRSLVSRDTSQDNRPSPDTSPVNTSPEKASPRTKTRRSTSPNKVALGDSLLQFFALEHPREDLGRPFADLAQIIVNTLPRNPERTVALRKLLEAKDCALRARLYVVPARGG